MGYTIGVDGVMMVGFLLVSGIIMVKTCEKNRPQLNFGNKKKQLKLDSLTIYSQLTLESP